MDIGEFIIRSDLYNTKDGCNTQVVIPCSTVKFIDSPLYQRFQRDYGNDHPQVNPGESSCISEVPQPEGAEAQAAEILPEKQELFSIPLTAPATEVMKSESSTMEAQLSQPPEMVNSVPETVNEVSEASDEVLEADSSANERPTHTEPSTPEPTEVELVEFIPEFEKSPTAPESEPDENPQVLIEQELQQEFRNLINQFNPDYPSGEYYLADFFAQIMNRHHFSGQAEQAKMRNRLDQFMKIPLDRSDYIEQLDLLFKEIWSNT